MRQRLLFTHDGFHCFILRCPLGANNGFISEWITWLSVFARETLLFAVGIAPYVNKPLQSCAIPTRLIIPRLKSPSGSSLTHHKTSLTIGFVHVCDSRTAFKSIHVFSWSATEILCAAHSSKYATIWPQISDETEKWNPTSVTSSSGEKSNRFDQQSCVCADKIADDRWEEVQINVIHLEIFYKANEKHVEN